MAAKIRRLKKWFVSMLVMVILFGGVSFTSAKESSGSSKTKPKSKTKAPAKKSGEKKKDSPKPTAKELLDKFSETQEKTKSFILKKMVVKKGRESLWNNVPLEAHYQSEIRFDSNRYIKRSSIWGDINPDYKIEKQNVNSNIYLWDGKNTYQYTKAYDDKVGHLIIRHYSESDKDLNKLTRSVFSGSEIGPLRGYLPQETDRIDILLEKADSIRVLNKMQKIGGSSCYVIEAKASSGSYKIWIDPAHSYQIAKAQVRKNPGDIVFVSKYKLPVGDHIRSYVDNVHFEKYGDVWIPVKWRTELSRTISKKSSSKNTSESVITEFKLNPDHDKLKSFGTDFIPDGTIVRTGKGGEKGNLSGRYTWQDGAVIGVHGKKVDLEKIHKEMKKMNTKS